MILNKNKLKSIIKESLQEMRGVDPIEDLVDEVEALILSRSNGDKSALGTVGQELMWRESGGRPEPEPEYDEAEADYEAEVARANAEHEKRQMQSFNDTDTE